MRFKKTIFIVSAFLLISSSSTFANDQSSMLKHIKHKIASIKQLLHRDNTKRHKLQKDLERTETNSNQISKKIVQTQEKLQEQQVLLNNLKTNQEKYESQLKLQQSLLENQITTAYMLGRQSYIKLLLNQEDSNQVSRILMYYRYISENRLEVINNIHDTISEIQNNQEKIQSQYKTFHDLQQEQKQQKQALAKTQQQRLHLLSVLSKHIKNRKQRLEILVNDKKRLEKTIASIARGKVNFPKANFAKLHKQLHWPTKGKVESIFGTQIDQSELRWGGVLIDAPEGQPVYAIANGKVVFAKWLSGYGLLLIVNHGNGYMTLYGRNHVIYKKVGDVIQKGDLIATVGQTGGYKKPALYFAVRHNGKPVNPALFIGR